MDFKWKMPEWMEEFRDVIEDREITKCTAEQAMSVCVGAPSWDIVRTRILFCYTMHDMYNKLQKERRSEYFMR